MTNINLPTIEIELEELPLIVTSDGFHAGLISGKAEIEYRNEFDFEVNRIWLEGYGPKGERRQIEVEISERPELWCAIEDQLTFGALKSHVQSRIYDDLEWVA